jgi:DNA-binding transcriptional regulator YhcF (GntR family)
LAVQFSANTNTVQKSLKEMMEEKIITPQRGKGNFVTEDEQIVNKLRNHIVNEMFDATYDKLHSLNMNDQEIIDSFKNYVKQKDEGDE